MNVQKRWVTFRKKFFSESATSKDTVDQKSSTNSAANETTSRSRSDSEGKKSVFHSFLFGFNVTYDVIKSLLIVVLVILFIGGTLAGGTGLGYFAYLVSGEEIPSYEEMQADITNIEATSSMFYAGGEVISDVRTDLKRTTVPLDQISPYVVDAIVTTEDEYFYEHDGVVPKAVARALFQELSGSSTTSGGSTLTQQLVKQQILTNEVSFERKANEILLAFRLENYFNKEEILEAYLNISPFGRNNLGQNIAGIQEAATGIFGVSADELTIPQAAFLAGLPQSPIVYSPYTNNGSIKEDLSAGMRRKDEVLFRMYREGKINETEYQDALSYNLSQDIIPREQNTEKRNTYVYDAVEKEARDILMEQLHTADGFTANDVTQNQDLYTLYMGEAEQMLRTGGYKVYSTIDKDIYEAMEAVMAEHGDELGSPAANYYTNTETDERVDFEEPVQNGGVLMDNATGRVISFVGGVDYTVSQVNHAFDSRRQPGSTIKPFFVYAPAIEYGLAAPATMIFESPAITQNWDSDNGEFVEREVTNVGDVVPNKWTSLREGLKESSNIVATKVFLQMKEAGLTPWEFLPQLGLGASAITPDDYDNDSLAIGGTSTGPTILEQTNAFSALANNGTYVEGYMIDRIEDATGEVVYEHETASTDVFSPETAYLTIDMMRDVLESGTASNIPSLLNFSADFAGKTGTTNNQKDIWFIASNPQVTFSSWIGYDNNGQLANTLETENGLHPSVRNRLLWARLMNAAHEANPTLIGADRSFQQPEGVVTETVLASTGMKPGLVELPNGRTTNISGATKTELFHSKFKPGTTTYDFSIQATDEELSRFWGNASTPSTDNSTDTEETEAEETETEENNEDAAVDTQETETTEESPENSETEEEPENPEPADEAADESEPDEDGDE